MCAQQGITDLSSSRSMEENGWNLENISTEDRLVLSKRGCWNLLDTIDKHKWMKQKWSNSTITTSLFITLARKKRLELIAFRKSLSFKQSFACVKLLGFIINLPYVALASNLKTFTKKVKF